MKIDTGQATLKVDDVKGDKYWSTFDDGDKDAYNMNPGECLQFDPKAFEEGAIIRIIEELS